MALRRPLGKLKYKIRVQILMYFTEIYNLQSFKIVYAV